MSDRRKRKAPYPMGVEDRGKKQVVKEEERVVEGNCEAIEEEQKNNNYTPPTGHALFASRVLLIIQSIPMGKVTSYGKVASLAYCPNHSRLVGRFLKEGICANGRGPWQRVIGASGTISLPPLSGGNLQRELLEKEGVIFNERTGKIARTSFMWEPSNEEIQQLRAAFVVK